MPEKRAPTDSPLQRHGVLIAQFAKFGVVGISNTVIAYALYALLWDVFGVWYLAASAIGFSVGAINGFVLNSSWTFRGHGEGNSAALRWFVVQGCGLALNEVLVATFATGLNKLIAQAFATAIVVVITFFANRRWTFRAQGPRGDGDGPRTVAPGTSAL